MHTPSIETALRSGGERTALIDGNSGESLSYAELLQRVHALRAHFGPTAQTVLLAAPNSASLAVVWLACLSGGHHLVPLSPDVTEHELAEARAKHAPNVVVSERGGAHDLTSTRIMALPIAAAPPAADGSVYLSTSGSTGKPKGMILRATQCVLTAQAIIASHQLTADDRCLTPLPFFHVNAPIVSLLSSLLSGGSVIIAPRYSTGQFWDWVERYQPTWLSLVPTMLTMLLATERPDFLDTATVRFVRTASAPLPTITLEHFEANFHLPVIETYGISEAASTIAANPVPPGVHKAGSVGLPVGVTMTIVNPKSGETVTTGTVGEVRIRGDNVIQHYEDAVGRDSFSDGWFRTGDLGYFDDDGYLFLTGRSKDIIIRGGENIFPREIEEVIMAFQAVQEVAVVGQPDPLYGEKIVAFITSEQADCARVLADYLHQRLNRSKIPAEVIQLQALPRTTAGKVDKPTLRNYGL